MVGRRDVRAAFAYKMVSYTPILLKKFAAQHRGEGFFIAKGGGEKIKRVAKHAKWNFSQVTNLILDPPHGMRAVLP